MSDKVDIKSLNYDELTEYITSIGEKKFRASQLYSWMHEKLADSYDEMTNISDKLKNTLKENTLYTCLEPVRVQESKIDGTKKYLFKLYDGNLIESVLMKYHHGNSVCISSQVGCKMGCRFCAFNTQWLCKKSYPFRNVRSGIQNTEAYRGKSQQYSYHGFGRAYG